MNLMDIILLINSSIPQTIKTILMKTYFLFLVVLIANHLNAQVIPIINENNFKYSFPINLYIHNNLIIFSAEDIYGREPWVTDGTNIGTNTLGNISGNNHSSNPQNFVTLGQKTFFYAYSDNAYRLYVTDGTLTGTKRFMNINDSGSGGSLSALFIKNDSLISFAANTDSFGLQLWVCDGTEKGTFPITKFKNPNMFYLICKIKDEYLFVYDHPDYGSEIFKTKGIDDEPELLKDINIGSSDAAPYFLYQLNDKYIFRAYDGINGSQLWVTDGTTSGTQQLNNVGSSNNYPFFTNFIKKGNECIFVARTSTEWTVWSTDGTNAGTKKYLTPINCSEISDIHLFQNTIYAVARGPAVGEELYIQKNDSLVFFRDFLSGLNSSRVSNFKTVNDTLLYFTAINSFSSSDIWVISKSNPNPQIQLRLPSNGIIGEMVYFKNNLIFSYNNFETGENYLNKLDHNLVGLNPITSNNHSIYPNPASESINIRTTQIIKNISVYNQLGQVVLEKVIEETTSDDLDIQNLDSGVYLLKIEDINGGIIWDKLIKS